MLFILFVVVAAYDKDCDERTKVLIEHGNSNYNGFYFVDKTYGGFQSCKTINTNDDFRKYINQKFPCNYEHCRSGLPAPWGCGNSKECYEVEHIIPKANNIPELEGCNTNIYGNLIMAYGVWNNQLSNTHFNEKKLIYGEIFDNAYKSVYFCCKGQNPTTIPVPNCIVPPSHPSVLAIVIFLFFIVVLVIGIVIWKNFF
jgi:hypothetical protein